MTYEQVNLMAYLRARIAFRDCIAAGWELAPAQYERERVYEASRQSFCARCGSWKHVLEFNRKGPQKLQSLCRLCQTNYAHERNTSDPEKWQKIRESPLP